MNDKVLIEGLKANAVIGIYDWEKAIRQPLLVDLTMAWNNKVPAASDRIEDALDYEAVSNAVLKLIEAQPFELIERVAEEVAALVLGQFNVPWIKVRVAKPTAIKQAASVAVEIERGHS